MTDRPLTTDRQASHTPGPWSNERIWDTPASRIHARVEGIPVALAEVFSMRNAGEREANARLIAAAPDMLDALRKAIQAMDYMGDILNGMDVVSRQDEETVKPAFAAVRAALNKAEGRS